MNEIPRPASPLPWVAKMHEAGTSGPVVATVAPAFWVAYVNRFAATRGDRGDEKNAAYIAWAANNATQLYEVLEALADHDKAMIRGGILKPFVELERALEILRAAKEPQ